MSDSMEYARFELEGEDIDLGQIVLELVDNDVLIQRAGKDEREKDYFIVPYRQHEKVFSYLKDNDISYYPAYQKEL